ncbi:MAG: hypothetical protein V1703_03105 [Candidatus Altiarchaeota archaeon]
MGKKEAVAGILLLAVLAGSVCARAPDIGPYMPIILAVLIILGLSILAGVLTLAYTIYRISKFDRANLDIYVALLKTPLLVVTVVYLIDAAISFIVTTAVNKELGGVMMLFSYLIFLTPILVFVAKLGIACYTGWYALKMGMDLKSAGIAGFIFGLASMVIKTIFGILSGFATVLSSSTQNYGHEMVIYSSIFTVVINLILAMPVSLITAGAAVLAHYVASKGK